MGVLIITKLVKSVIKTKDIVAKIVVLNLLKTQMLKKNNYLPTATENKLNVTELGLRIPKHRKKGQNLSLLLIKQEWLKVEVEKFVRYISSTKQYTTVSQYLSNLNEFSNFIGETHSSLINFHQINRSVIVDYLDYLNSKNLGIAAKRSKLSTLNTFFETGVSNNWFDLPPYLIRHEDYPKKYKFFPRDIPEEVMSQLNQHLDALPQPIIRMVLIIQECGLRIGELCQLPFNCLKKDGNNEWSIQFMRWQMLKETKLPISPELARVIQEQQYYIRDSLGDKYEYLFCGRQAGFKDFRPNPNVISDEAFIRFLKKLAEEFDIRDNSGKRWNFQTHQFRHTVGTRMVNLGVPLPVIQRYLGHESPEMTMTYAHLKDETMKKAVAEFRGKMVNIAGQVVNEFDIAEKITEGADPAEVDAVWLRKNILARALPDGLCIRPAVKGKCPYEVNMCHGCSHFVADEKYLPQYEDELERALSMIEWAQQNPQSSRAEIVLQDNLDIKKKLETVISSLKTKQTNFSTNP